MSTTVLGIQIAIAYLKIPLHQTHGPILNCLLELSSLLLLFCYISKYDADLYTL